MGAALNNTTQPLKISTRSSIFDHLRYNQKHQGTFSRAPSLSMYRAGNSKEDSMSSFTTYPPIFLPIRIPPTDRFPESKSDPRIISFTGILHAQPSPTDHAREGKCSGLGRAREGTRLHAPPQNCLPRTCRGAESRELSRERAKGEGPLERSQLSSERGGRRD